MSFLLLAVGCTVPNNQYLGGDGGAIDGEGAGNADAEIERDGGAPDLAFNQPDGGSPEDGAVHDSDGSTPFNLAEHPTDLLNPSCGGDRRLRPRPEHVLRPAQHLGALRLMQHRLLPRWRHQRLCRTGSRARVQAELRCHTL